MPQIHLHAEPGDYAPVVILPGDPIRATKIAARFDGGLEATRQVNSNRGLVGYTGTVQGVPVSVQVTMMGSPTTGIVVEELLMLGVETLIRVGTTGAFKAEIGDVIVAMSSAGNTGHANVIGGGEASAPTGDLEVILALRDAAQAAGLTTHVGPIVTGDAFYGDEKPVHRWGRRGYLSVEMETATLYLLAMRERAKGRTVRAGSVLTVSDILYDTDDPEALKASGGKRFYRPPEEEVNRRVDLTIGAALAAAAVLGRVESDA
jgi:DeoD family purine-nucleoside phosphorylase